MWGQSSNKPAVLFAAYLVFLQSQQPSLALQYRAGKHRQLHFPSWCLREEQIFPSLQHNRGFQLFFCQSCNSLGLDSRWTGCCTYFRSTVHAPSNVHVFLCRQMQQTSEERRRWWRAQSHQMMGEGARAVPVRLCSWRRLSRTVENLVVLKRGKVNREGKGPDSVEVQGRPRRAQTPKHRSQV